MKTLREILGIGTLMMAFTGCGQEQHQYKVISARPLSIAYDSCIYEFSVVLDNMSNTKSDLNLGRTFSTNRKGTRDAVALIQSKIPTHEEVKLYGYYKRDQLGQKYFHIESVKVEDCRIDLNRVSGNPYVVEREE